jgi:cobalt-zinc-cadmium efflux system membrane fusion protein
MSQSDAETAARTTAPQAPSGAPSLLGNILSWALTLAMLGGLAAYLFTSKPPTLDTQSGATTSLDVAITDRGTLRMPSSGSLAEGLRRATVTPRRTSTPLIEAIGTLLAAPSSLSPRRSSFGWQFATTEILSTYTDLLQANAEVAFQSRQAQSTRALHAAKVRTQTHVVERLRRLVEIGSDSARDLAAEEATLLERRIEAQREIYEVDNLLRAAQRRQEALSRQLEQIGLSSDLLRGGERRAPLVVAEIPESRIEQVTAGQTCRVRFIGFANDPKLGRIARILPTISPTQRTLRVVVVVDEPSQQSVLRPGMFANVEIGIEEREALIIAQSALVHVGRADYVLVVSGDELLITPVSVGEARGSEIEVITGLSPGATIISDGAVLLKPLIVQAIERRRT